MDTIADVRVLGRIRLSRTSEESTSAERQRELIEHWASANGHEVVGWAEDLDVSGALSPFDTPKLGPWLTEPKLDEWDILVAWKLDRLARRAVPLHRLFGVCQDHDKTLVCVSDNIDLSTWVGRLIAAVIAGVAEGELEAIRERTKASHRKLREMGRWPGGRPAFGYRAREREDAAGWELVVDSHKSAVVTTIVDRVLGGESTESIARDLTERGEPSPSGRGPWHGQTIRNMLRSKTLLGHVTHNRTTVRDSLGYPVMKGPPLIQRDRFDRLQATLDGRSFKTTRSRGASPLLGVAVCLACGAALHLRQQTVSGKLYRYYRCPAGCGRQIRAEEVEGRVEERFLSRIGHLKVQERVYVPAENHQIELDEAVRAVDEITALYGATTSATVRSRLRGQLKSLDFRINELESLPTTDARWEHRETAKTYAEVWAEAAGVADPHGARRQILLRSGITLAILKDGEVIEDDFRVPDDLMARLSTPPL